MPQITQRHVQKSLRAALSYRSRADMEARLGEKLHGLSATALSGRTVDFKACAGKPLLMVNVASC